MRFTSKASSLVEPKQANIFLNSNKTKDKWSKMVKDTRIQQLETEVEELRGENAGLRQRISALTKKLAAYENHAAKQFRYDQDYLPYGDTEYDRD